MPLVHDHKFKCLTFLLLPGDNRLESEPSKSRGCNLTPNRDALGVSDPLWIKIDPGAVYEDALDALGVLSELNPTTPTLMGTVSEVELIPLNPGASSDWLLRFACEALETQVPSTHI